LQLVEEIDFMLESGTISRFNSEYASPIHLVPKKDTVKFHLVGGDYRG